MMNLILIFTHQPALLLKIKGRRNETFEPNLIVIWACSEIVRVRV